MASNDAAQRWLREMRKKYPRHGQGSRLDRFVAAVSSDPTFQSILNTIQPANRPKPSLGFTFLRESAMNGCCEIVKEMFDDNNVNASDEDGVTALHIAAEYGNYEDVKVLLEAGAKVTADQQGLTPLHVAALSAQPNAQIAELLIKYTIQENEEGYELINAQSCGCSTMSTKGNTALHFAAGNEQISYEFIQALESTDPSIKNEKGETAFHVAARAQNPDIVVCMLEVFTPAKKGWRMTDMEGGSKLLEMCTRRGNSTAVALLIKYGADIDEKVLFGLIVESVKNPTKTESLIEVYRTITDNCVLWSWLKATPE